MIYRPGLRGEVVAKQCFISRLVNPLETSFLKTFMSDAQGIAPMPPKGTAGLSSSLPWDLRGPVKTPPWQRGPRGWPPNRWPRGPKPPAHPPKPPIPAAQAPKAPLPAAEAPKAPLPAAQAPKAPLPKSAAPNADTAAGQKRTTSSKTAAQAPIGVKPGEVKQELPKPDDASIPPPPPPADLSADDSRAAAMRANIYTRYTTALQRMARAKPDAPDTRGAWWEVVKNAARAADDEFQEAARLRINA